MNGQAEVTRLFSQILRPGVDPRAVVRIYEVLEERARIKTSP